MSTIVLLATGWGSKHGGINVVNMELTRALAEVLGPEGQVVCVVPYADRIDVGRAMLLSLGFDQNKLPDFFDPGWLGTVAKKLIEAGINNVDWCIGHDAITGAAANAMKKDKMANYSAVICHMSYADYQGVKHPEYSDVERKIREQKQILRGADLVLAIGPLLKKSASDIVDRVVPQIVPGLPEISPRPSREHFEAVSFGRFDRANDRIKQIQLVAEGVAEAVLRAHEHGGPQMLRGNPKLKLIGVSESGEESQRLRQVMQERAKRIVNLRTIPYQEDRRELYQEIAGSSVALMLSWHEGFGLTGWEAIAAEVPLIVTQQSGLYELLRDNGLHGFVYSLPVDGSYGDDETPNFTDEDRKRVADQILNVVQDPETARKASKNLREALVSKGCTWGNAAKSVLQALEIVPPLPNPLANYLTAIREVAGKVILAGDHKPRSLQNVFVELEITRNDVTERQEPLEEEEKDPALETELRRRKSAPWRQLTETIPAEDLLDFSHRTLITGAAGTGKSTLLRFLACAAAKRREKIAEARIPVWLPRLPPHRDLKHDIASALARYALENLKLGESAAEVFQAIREAIVSGQAMLLIDSLDEASVVERAHAEEWLLKLEGRVVLASRPLIEGAPLKDVKLVTLHGIPGIAAEQLLRKYFEGEDWVDGLLQALRNLPDGQTWLETPVLLGLAATLYRSAKVLPYATIELYRRAVDHLLDSERLPQKYRGGMLRVELRTLARDRLLPNDGAPRIIFDLHDVPYDRLEVYRQTGLFEGESRFRFTHLTLGEFLAAEAEIDLAVERAKLRAIAGSTTEGSALEIVPMAHALQGELSLRGALEDARGSDLPDHRLLRLLLKAIGYGGNGVAAFCASQASEVIRLVAQRLDSPSGRFGESEIALMDAAERAFWAMGEVANKADVERAFARLLRMPGDVGTEAYVATWILGARKPERRESDWWPTVDRQARTLIRSGIGIDEVVALTQGADSQNQWRAACHLAEDQEVRPRLRPLLYHDDDMGRRWMSRNLASDPISEPDWRERLGDEDDITREFCVNWLAGSLEYREIYLPRLRDMLVRDPSDSVRAAVIAVLADDPAARPAIRDILFTTLDGSDYRAFDLGAAAILALACDPESEAVIEAYVKLARRGLNVRLGNTFKKLASIPRWRQLLLKKLSSPGVSKDEILAFAGAPDADEPLRQLLDTNNHSLVCAAIEALGERADQDRLIRFLDHENRRVRCTAIVALGGHPGSEPILRAFLVKLPEERIAAAKALNNDVESVELVRDNLLFCPQIEVQQAAVSMLSKHPVALSMLSQYFEDTKPSFEHRYVRGQVLKALASAPGYQNLVEGALEDPHDTVRAEAVRALAANPTMTSRLESLFFSNDADVLVYEAFCELMLGESFVRNHLVWCLNVDLGALRFSAFRYLVDREEDRKRLREMVSSPDVREEWRTTILGPLTRDPGSIDLVRACVHSDSSEVQEQALRVLRHDRFVRGDLREKARDVEWLRSTFRATRGIVLNVLRDDPEAHPILASHLAIEDEHFLSLIVPALRGYRHGIPALLKLLDHPSSEVQGAAMEALGDYEPARARLVAALEPDASSEREPDADWLEVARRRRGAANALKNVPELRGKFRELLTNTDKKVREAAIHAVSSDRSPEARRLLRERLHTEEDEDLRFQIISGLRDDPEAVAVLRERLHNDYHRAVRKAAAAALGLGDLSPAYPLRESPSIACILDSLTGAPNPALDRLRSFVRAPHRFDLDADLEFAEDLLAWLCARLCWAYEIDRERDGQVLGELANHVGSFNGSEDPILIRVAMDTFVLPRERFLRPNHNLMEVWEVARHLVSVTPPTVVLACADVAFAHVQPPLLEPGEVRFGPTFFGFRIHRRPSSP